MKVPPHLRKDVLQLLFDAAKNRQLVEYGSIMRACHIPRGQAVDNDKGIGHVVGLISEWTCVKWRGIYLSSIVVHKGSKYPGGGFFGVNGIPKEFHRDQSGWTDRALTDDERDFIEKCQRAVFGWAEKREVSVHITRTKR